MPPAELALASRSGGLARRRVLRDPPEILLTTPESLEVMFRDAKAAPLKPKPRRLPRPRSRPARGRRKSAKRKAAGRAARSPSRAWASPRPRPRTPHLASQGWLYSGLQGEVAVAETAHIIIAHELTSSMSEQFIPLIDGIEKSLGRKPRPRLTQVIAARPTFKLRPIAASARLCRHGPLQAARRRTALNRRATHKGHAAKAQARRISSQRPERSSTPPSPGRAAIWTGS